MDGPRKYLPPAAQSHLPDSRGWTSHRVAVDQPPYRTSGAVNESRLNPAPRLNETRTVTWGERADVQTLHPLCALFESGFRLPPAAVFLQSTVIFSATKLSAQPSSAALSEKKPRGYAYKHNHGETNN